MNRIALFVALMIFWVMLTWAEGVPESAHWQSLIAGGLVSLLVAFWLGRTGVATMSKWLDPRRYFWLIVFLGYLSGNIIKANLEVAYRVLHPQLPIRPGIVHLKTRLKTPSARTLLGNAITLCPGTLTVELSDEGDLMVHWIYVNSEDEDEASRQILHRFELLIERILE